MKNEVIALQARVSAKRIRCWMSKESVYLLKGKHVDPLLAFIGTHVYTDIASSLSNDRKGDSLAEYKNSNNTVQFDHLWFVVPKKEGA
jgi:hypothetical protein